MTRRVASAEALAVLAARLVAAPGRGPGGEAGPPPGLGLRRSDHPAQPGRSSATIAPAFAQVPELAAALSHEGAALLDVGAGVGGLYDSPPDPLAQRLVALRTIRGGGDPTTDASALTAAGFRDARELERTWATPLRFILGVR